ncbi:MAG: InlB B-repeat-containing protein [Lachnospiraceae bacterium]|nr:InlB B-repeat-containing protein [Lachnospiraceae bacterium]
MFKNVIKPKKNFLLLLFVACIYLCSMTTIAEEVESEFTVTDFCAYWSYGYQELHIYDSFYLMKDTKNWEAIDTDNNKITGKILVIGEENDEESSAISYTLSTTWESYKNVIYTGENIPEHVSFEYIATEDLTIHNISGYDMIIIEFLADQDTLSESLFIKLDEMVKKGQYIVFDTDINDRCSYTEEKDGSVAVIDSRNKCLLISSNEKPGYFANLKSQGSSGNTVTLASIANVNNLSTEAYRESVKKIKILPTYNCNVLTNTFYIWYDAKEIILPSFIDTISDNCFKGYSGLQSVNLDNVKTIGVSAFQNCGFLEMVIPNGVETIHSKAFYLNHIHTIEIASSVSVIDELAFGSDFLLETLWIHVNENGITFGKNSFCMDSDTEVLIDYEGEDSGKEQMFSPFVDNNMDVTADNFSKLNMNDLFLVFAGASESVEEYTVILVDNKVPLMTYTKQVINGNIWGKYLETLPNQEYSDFKLIFKGWTFEDGVKINEKDIVNLDDNIKIYSLYERENETNTCTVNFPEYNKTIEIHYGDTLGQYNIPNPQQEDDIFLGWSPYYPVEVKDILTDNSRWLISSNKTIDLYGVWESDLDDLMTTQTLSMMPNYYLNRNNTGHIYYYNSGKKERYTLDQTSFSKEDEKNADVLLNKIVKAGKTASKICIVPSNYKLDVNKAKKKGYYVIKSGLSIQKLKRALTFMNCKYFQYLLIIQTPYVEQEEKLNGCTNIGYEMKINDWEIKDSANFEGWVYGINASKFMKYYNICNRVNSLTDDLVNKVFKFDTNTTVVEALKVVNDYVIQFTAYDNPQKIYDLKWFLEETSQSRNLDKQASHHGVCASYSKLAHAVLGKCGYETLPCAVWESPAAYKKYKEGNLKYGPVHSINQVIIDGKEYYCDFCWASANDPMQYMFLTVQEVNEISCHYHPDPDNYGTIIYFKGTNNDFYGTRETITVTFDANGGDPKKVKVEKAKNKKIEKLAEVTKKGYDFAGWYTKRSGGKKITTSTKIKSSITLYAHWKKITVKKGVIKSAKSERKKTALVKFNKLADVKGYQIQYSTSNSLKKEATKTITIKGNKTFKKTIKNLKNKTYYIRVRAYKTDSAKSKVYGKWSKTKRVKIK